MKSILLILSVLLVGCGDDKSDSELTFGAVVPEGFESTVSSPAEMLKLIEEIEEKEIKALNEAYDLDAYGTPVRVDNAADTDEGGITVEESIIEDEESEPGGMYGETKVGEDCQYFLYSVVAGPPVGYSAIRAVKPILAQLGENFETKTLETANEVTDLQADSTSTSFHIELKTKATSSAQVSTSQEIAAGANETGLYVKYRVISDIKSDSRDVKSDSFQEIYIDRETGIARISNTSNSVQSSDEDGAMNTDVKMDVHFSTEELRTTSLSSFSNDGMAYSGTQNSSLKPLETENQYSLFYSANVQSQTINKSLEISRLDGKCRVEKVN